MLLGKVLATPANLLLLDEPTNHLDLPATESLIEAIDRFPGTVVLVTHSEQMLHRLCNRLVIFDGGRVRVHEGNYGDFLARIGWVEETEPGTGAIEKPRRKRTNRKDLRRERAALIAERSKVLKPLARLIERCESRIVELEDEIGRLEGQLITASGEQDSERIAELSSALHERRQEESRLFIQLEETSIEHDGRRGEFERRLSELE